MIPWWFTDHGRTRHIRPIPFMCTRRALLHSPLQWVLPLARPGTGDTTATGTGERSLWVRPHTAVQGDTRPADRARHHLVDPGNPRQVDQARQPLEAESNGSTTLSIVKGSPTAIQRRATSIPRQTEQPWTTGWTTGGETVLAQARVIGPQAGNLRRCRTDSPIDRVLKQGVGTMPSAGWTADNKCSGTAPEAARAGHRVDLTAAEEAPGRPGVDLAVVAAEEAANPKKA